LSLNRISFNTLLNCCISCSKYDIALKILELYPFYFIEKDLYTYVALIQGSKNKSDVLKWFQEIIYENIQPDEIAYRIIFSIKINQSGYVLICVFNHEYWIGHN
jgi:hypothetical protein